VRQAAVSSLGNLNNPRIIEPLLPKLNDPAWGVRQAAVGALSGFDTPQVLNSLTPRLKDPSWEVRYTAARSLGGNIQKMPRLVESFKPLLKDSSPLVRQSAVMSLGKIEGIEITRSITPLLEDQDTAVRHAATLVLGEKINRYRQFLLDPFINLLTRESNLLIKEAAAASLKDLEVADELKLKQVKSLLKDIPVPDKTRSVLVEVPGVTGFLGLDPFVSSRQPGWSEDTLLVKYVRTTQEAVIKEFNWPGKLAPSPLLLSTLLFPNPISLTLQAAVLPQYVPSAVGGSFKDFLINDVYKTARDIGADFIVIDQHSAANLFSPSGLGSLKERIAQDYKMDLERGKIPKKIKLIVIPSGSPSPYDFKKVADDVVIFAKDLDLIAFNSVTAAAMRNTLTQNKTPIIGFPSPPEPISAHNYRDDIKFVANVSKILRTGQLPKKGSVDITLSTDLSSQILRLPKIEYTAGNLRDPFTPQLTSSYIRLRPSTQISPWLRRSLTPPKIQHFYPELYRSKLLEQPKLPFQPGIKPPRVPRPKLP
jgi:hypothetical protein